MKKVVKHKAGRGLSLGKCDMYYSKSSQSLVFCNMGDFSPNLVMSRIKISHEDILAVEKQKKRTKKPLGVRLIIR